MKQRVLVMNNSKIVQVEKDGEWKNNKIEKAGLLKPGIYNIYNATEAKKTNKYDGLIIHLDKEKVYQKIGNQFISHGINDFKLVPKIGADKSISYNNEGEATASRSEKLSYSQSL